MSVPPIPGETIRVFARSIYSEARNYGFSQLDLVRLINELMDVSASGESSSGTMEQSSQFSGRFEVDSGVLRSDRLQIRFADPENDIELLEQWINDAYGRHFLLSCAAAEMTSVEQLLGHSNNRLGIVLHDNAPIGAVAYLDIDTHQRRAELRKLIGSREARGKGFAEEATRLWISYGHRHLGLQKIYVSTLQTHLRNIQLNESIGFRVEGVLHNEVLIDGQRYDVLRMGLCLEDEGDE